MIRVTVESVDLEARARAAAEKATETVMLELFGAFQQAFTATVWQWPRLLQDRKLNGATVTEKLRSYLRGEGSWPTQPRNIIDFGNLRQTGYWGMDSPFVGVFTWSAGYASYVHEGAWIRPWGTKTSRRVYLPPRPWTRAVLGQEQVSGIKPFPIEERLKNVWLRVYQRGV